MSETSGAEPPRRGLSPAAWGAISAVAVAVIGATATLTAAWWQRAPAPAAKAVAAAPAKAAPDEHDPSTWGGAYSGEVREPGGAAFAIVVDLSVGCMKGAICGTIRVPHIPCSGRLTLVEVRPEGAEFSVGHFDKASDPKVCQPGGGEVLRRLPTGDLDYTATYSGAHGVLSVVD